MNRRNFIAKLGLGAATGAVGSAAYAQPAQAPQGGSFKLKYAPHFGRKQITEENLIPNIDKCWDEIAYFQCGDNPGRKEPGTGEINYRRVFQHIHKKGWKGIMGMEHGVAVKGAEGVDGLIRAYREADSFDV